MPPIQRGEKTKPVEDRGNHFAHRAVSLVNLHGYKGLID